MSWKGLQHIITVSQLVVFLLYIMLRYTSCLESYWEEMSSLQNYLPYSDSYFKTMTASSLFTCMSHCFMTEGCCFISYIAISSLCIRHRKMTGYAPQKSSSVWNLLKDDDCPCGWYRFEHSCFLFADVELTWPDSVTFCQRLDAELVEVDTRPKDEFLQKVANNKKGFKNIWVAGSDNVTEGSWVWITSGSPMTNYTNWSAEQPDNDGGSSGGNANCICLGTWFNYAWDDCHCLWKFAPVCEKPLTVIRMQKVKVGVTPGVSRMTNRWKDE